MKKDTLILVQDRNNYFFPYVESSNIDIWNTYKSNKLWNKILRKLPFLAFFSFEMWKKEIKNYKKIIIFDSVYNVNLGKYLAKRVNRKNIFVYSWNSALDKKQEALLLCAKRDFKVYSFDKCDCEKYNLEYASMVYSRNAVFVKQRLSYKYDVVFVGKDKGRVDYLHELFEVFSKKGLKCMFYILGTPIKKYETDNFKFVEKYLSYSKNVELINSSKVILDIQQDGQDGLTIRIVESMFYGKKVITNKKNISDYDFYCKNNIFTLGNDSIDGLVEFVNGEIESVDDSILNRYEINTWANLYFQKQ